MEDSLEMLAMRHWIGNEKMKPVVRLAVEARAATSNRLATEKLPAVTEVDVAT